MQKPPEQMTDVAPLKGYALRLWEMLEEVQAQVELPEDLEAMVSSLLWREWAE